MIYVFALGYENGDERKVSEITHYHAVDTELTDDGFLDVIEDLIISNPDAHYCDFKFIMLEAEPK
jgi:hypothetical protein